MNRPNSSNNSRTDSKNIAASVRQRLLNLARGQKEDFQLVLTRYVLERLLYRLSQSDFGDQFILKGAMLFQVWSNETHRPTRDIDFLGYGEPSPQRYLQLFQQLCAVEVPDDGLKFDPTTIVAETMKDEEQYQGIRIKMHCRLASALIPVQVDVGFGDAITPAPVRLDYPALLDFEPPTLLAYTRETSIAEKYQAMVMLGIANSRMKDFFDLWLLSRQFEFSGKVVAAALRATFRRRNTPIPAGPPLALTSEFANDPAKQKQWKAFIRKGSLNIEGKSFAEIIGDLDDFLVPPTFAISRNQTFAKQWRKGGPWF